MRLEFVNHASYVLESGGVRLLCDPWLEGTAFNDGWALLAPSTFSYEDFARVTHLWFSHEHPDHFSPANLRKIAPEHRQRITVLYQRTADKRVVDFCRKLGFGEVRELDPGRLYDIGPGFELCVNPCVGFEDSWLYVRTPETTLLNVNDCGLNERAQLQAIKAEIGRIDVLTTQFSVSAWDGNRDEIERLRAGARSMLERAILQCEVLEPRFVVPFASFIWFCHEENAYMNQAFLGLDEVERAFRERTRATPVLMYPGDEWTMERPAPTADAVARYLADQASLPTRPLAKATTVAREDLVEASRGFCRLLCEGSDESRVRLSWAAQSYRQCRRRGQARGISAQVRDVARLALLEVEPALVFVTDHGASYLFHPMRGLELVTLPRENCDIEVGSESLHYAFKFPWGGQTLMINGRFHELRPGARESLFGYFHMAANRSAGRVLTWGSLADDLARNAARVLALFGLS